MQTRTGCGFFAVIIALVVIGLTAFSACDAAQDTGGIPPGESPITFLYTQAAPLIPTRWDDGAPTDIAQGANDFAFALGAAMLENHDPAESFVISPFSVWLLLAALANATDEAYLADLTNAIGAGESTPAEINRAASRLMFDLTNERMRDSWGEDYVLSQLHIANAIFVNHDNLIRTAFARTFLDFYRGAAMNLDFASPHAVAAVNAWASENTDGLIDSIVEEFSAETVAALINAIFFSDNWRAQFSPHNTHRDTFYSPTGEVMAYFMERQMFNEMHFEDDMVQSVTLGFEKGGGMTIILPHDGDAIGLLRRMDSAYFERIRQESVFAEGRFVMPRFRVENRLDDSLVDALVGMGVPLFCDVRAVLGDRLVMSDMPIFIEEAVQVAMIEVDEEGATAAAVTIMPAAAGSAPAPPELRVFEMICNTPFVFVLHRWVTDGDWQVLFTGVVIDPTS